MKCTFLLTPDGAVSVSPTATPTGPGGMIGDARWDVLPGDDAWGIPYADLAAAGSGTIEVAPDGKSARIVSPKKS